MVGHSIGEYVAACLAGVFSLEDALAIVAARGRLMQSLPAGSMLGVRLPEQAVRSLIDGNELSLAAINSPSLCTVSGAGEALEGFKERLSERKVDYRPLHTSHAFHSSMMDPVLGPFADEVKRAKRNPPRIPFISNVTGTWITSAEAVAPEYWAKHLRQTVRFSDGVRELMKEPNRVFLEVGPGNTLSTLVKQHLNGSEQKAVLSSIRHPQEREDDAFILNTLGRLWLTGVEVDWFAFHEKESRHRVPLPTYPFERRRNWVEPAEPPRGYFAARAGLSRKQETPSRPAEPEIIKEEPAPRDSELQDEYVAPRTDLEEILSTVWQEFFGIEKIGTHDSFFDLGGDSLSATQLISRIRGVLRVDVEVRSLFEAPTIAGFAEYIEAIRWTAAESPALGLALPADREEVEL
jgi:acyl transferase domain-containing protein/aryl carrier-like protein